MADVKASCFFTISVVSRLLVAAAREELREFQ